MKHGKKLAGRTATIEREEVSTAIWIPFFSAFNDTYHGRRARVEVQDGKGASETLFEQLTLQSVATTLGTPASTFGVDKRAPNTISITVLQSSGALLTHKADDVTRVHKWRDSSRNTEGLEIETEEGKTTRLTFAGG